MIGTRENKLCIFLFFIVYCLIIILICYELMTYAAVKNESILLVPIECIE